MIKEGLKLEMFDKLPIRRYTAHLVPFFPISNGLAYAFA
jgi:hypothetical protein